MVELTLSAPLRRLIASQDGPGASGSKSIELGAGSWDEVAGEIRARFPALAARVLSESGRVASGFALVLGDEVVHDPSSLELRSGDELFLIPVLAGG